MENVELHSSTLLSHFFNDLNFQFMQLEVVDEAEMKGHALQFVNYDTAGYGKYCLSSLMQLHHTESSLTLCASCTQAPMQSNAG